MQFIFSDVVQAEIRVCRVCVDDVSAGAVCDADDVALRVDEGRLAGSADVAGFCLEVDLQVAAAADGLAGFFCEEVVDVFFVS